MTKIISSGKLILSGEHAVVYGAPACAIALNKTIEGDYQSSSDAHIRIQCVALNIEEEISIEKILTVHKTLTQRYVDFTHHNLEINQVIEHPIELCWFTIAQVFAEAGFVSALDITLKTDIPLGCGMGSSAALIINLILGINALFDLRFSQEKIFSLALAAENLQHGYSSGLDIQLSLTGGMHIFRKNHALLPVKKNEHDALSLPLQYFNSGKPECTTGECVAFVKQQNFPTSLWQEFEKTTLAFVAALQSQNQENLMHAIKKNHRLLCHIGVVPQAIQAIIAAIEAQGGAAKICGAGSIRGNNAGIIFMTNNVAWPETTPLIEADLHKN